jgi:hypothetical protein
MPSLNYLHSLVDLVGLLRWRQQKDKIHEVLNSLFNVRGDEIMKVSLNAQLYVFFDKQTNERTNK